MRWGILGAAKFAREHMGPAIHAAKGAELVALATSDAAKAAPFLAFAPGLRVHQSYDALLADPEIDAVYVPCPTICMWSGRLRRWQRANMCFAKNRWQCGRAILMRWKRLRKRRIGCVPRRL